METTIPIYNLYYLLCYAWDRLEEKDLVDISSTTPPRDVFNLLGGVLGNGVRALIRRGFERGYIERSEELAGIRGKIALSPTVRKQLLQHGRAECTFDEIEYDTPANRIILSTLTLLARSDVIEFSLRHELNSLSRSFRDVRFMRATIRDCQRVVIHRNNRHYGFLIDICALILGMVLPDENGAEKRFRDFTRDHQAMARLFEDFVRQFYIQHADECGISEVSSKKIEWAGNAIAGNDRNLWPAMKSDICLQRRTSPMVIDCKFYQSALKETQHGGERLSSANLYQVFTYTQNLARVAGWEKVEGLLLYAQTGDPFDVENIVCGHRLRAASIDLNLQWPAIHARLLAVVRESPLDQP